MGNSLVQNCQRGTIFLTFIATTFFLVMSIINMSKKRIDPIEGDEEGGERYKEGEGEAKGT